MHQRLAPGENALRCACQWPRFRDDQPHGDPPRVAGQRPARHLQPASSAADANCRGRKTTTKVAFDEATALGFSANDVLAFALGKHDTQLHWLERDGLELTPETGVHALQVVVELRGKRARVLDPEASIIGHGLVCQTWMEIDVTITLQSDQRAFNERIDTTLYVQSPDVAYVSATAQAAALGGAFAVHNTASDPPDAEPTSLSLAPSVSRHGISGSLTSEWSTHATELHQPATQKLPLAYLGPNAHLRGISWWTAR